jgi:FkbM family methyltransferase
MELQAPPLPGVPVPLSVSLERHGDFVAFYEVLVERCYRQLLEQIVPGDVVVDAGANIGLFSLLASYRTGKEGVVLAIEPNPQNFQRLVSLVERNHLDNVRVFPYALGAPGQSEAWMAGDGIRSRVVGTSTGQYAVRSVTLDDLVREQRVRPTLLKMDIEGSECGAFEGLKENLRHLRAVSIEIHDRIAEEVIRSALGEFRVVLLDRSGWGAYIRFGCYHPLLLSRIEWNNRFLSVRRALRDQLDVSGSVGGYPVNWFARRVQGDRTVVPQRDGRPDLMGEV